MEGSGAWCPVITVCPTSARVRLDMGLANGSGIWDIAGNAGGVPARETQDLGALPGALLIPGECADQPDHCKWHVLPGGKPGCHVDHPAEVLRMSCRPMRYHHRHPLGRLASRGRHDAAPPWVPAACPRFPLA